MRRFFASLLLTAGLLPVVVRAACEKPVRDRLDDTAVVMPDRGLFDEGVLASCPDGEPVVSSGVDAAEPDQLTEGGIGDAAPTRPWWPWAAAMLIVSGLFSIAKQGLERMKERPTPPEKPNDA